MYTFSQTIAYINAWFRICYTPFTQFTLIMYRKHSSKASIGIFRTSRDTQYVKMQYVIWRWFSVTHSFSVTRANIAINNTSLKTTLFGIHFRLELSRLIQSMVRQVSRSHAQRLTPVTNWMGFGNTNSWYLLYSCHNNNPGCTSWPLGCRRPQVALPRLIGLSLLIQQLTGKYVYNIKPSMVL